jgi:hypothetical protein
MQTSLPDLPFPHYGIEVTFERSAARTSPRACPRSDLTTFTPWVSFTNDMEQAFDAAMTRRNLAHGTQITVGINLRKPGHVSNEELLRSHAHHELHVAVRDVLDELGIEGEFIVPGSVVLIGDPDFSWIPRFPQSQMHPKLVVRVSPSPCTCVRRPYR